MENNFLKSNLELLKSKMLNIKMYEEIQKYEN